MAELRILDFNGTRVSFVVGRRIVLVCVSELSKSLSNAKQPSRWLATKQAKDLIRQISQNKRIQAESLVNVRHGGVINGTWMYAEIAVAYAEWLSPEMGKSCSEGIQEVIRVETSK